MITGNAEVTSFVLNHMKIADMRPREDFERFDQVHVIGTGITGRIARIDADRRLAWLITAKKDGWWYLKDLERLSHAESQRKPAKIEAEFDSLFDDFFKKAKSPYSYKVVSDANA